MRTQFLFFAALLLLTPFSQALIDELEPFETIPEEPIESPIEPEDPEYHEPSYTIPHYEPSEPETKPTTPVEPIEPVSEPKTVSTPPSKTLTNPEDNDSDFSDLLNDFKNAADHDNTTEDGDSDDEDGKTGSNDDEKKESDEESDEDTDEDGDEKSDDDSDDHSDSIITNRTPNLLEGTWYVYNSTEDVMWCCLPSGTVEFYSVGGENYIEADFEGLTCGYPAPPTTSPLSLSDSYIELPEYTSKSKFPEDGYAYYVSGFRYENFWPNKTQQVLLSIESFSSDSNAVCSFTLSMSAQTIFEKTH